MLDKLKTIIGEIRQIRWDVFHIERNIVKESFHWAFSVGGVLKVLMCLYATE